MIDSKVIFKSIKGPDDSFQEDLQIPRELVIQTRLENPLK